jgi:DNA polymerase-3 subunit delta'
MSPPPLIGNAALRARLCGAIEAGRAHHCYLFEGPEGVGKATTALWLAAWTNCAAGERPCGRCPSCRQIAAGSHPDVILVGPDPEKATRVISVAQAHAVVSALALKPHSARRRFVILDPADALNDEAANALLKTLEEPPHGTQFVLVTARIATLLPTVRSRSQRVRFGPVPTAELAAWLTARGADPRVAEGAEGSPGLALRLGDGEGERRAAVRRAIAEVVEAPLVRLFAFAEAKGKKEEGAESEAAFVVEAVEALLADVARVASGRPVDDVAARWHAAMWPGGAARLCRQAALARERLRLNVNGRLVIEALLGQASLELARA